MTLEQIAKSVFEENWLIATFVFPELAILWAIATKQFGWALACVAVKQLDLSNRRVSLANLVVKKLKNQ